MKEYLDLLRYVRENGIDSDDRTGVGTLSDFGAQYKVDLNKGFPLLTSKKVHYKSIFIELMWFLRGRTDNQWLNSKKVTIWDEWATEEQCAKFNRPEGDLGPIYGHQWRNFGGGVREKTDKGWKTSKPGFDQIAWLMEELQNNPNSRRLIVTGWNPKEANQVCLPPCHTLWQVYCRNGKISIHLYQRSADMFLGVPFNLASYSLLAHLIAHALDLDVGYFVHSFGDYHIYKNHIEQVDLQLSRTTKKLPTIKIDDRLRGKGLETLLTFELEDIKIENYEPHPGIKAEVAV